MNKAQCKGRVYPLYRLYWRQCRCNLHSFTTLSAVLARLLGGFAPVLLLAGLRDVVNQDLMLVS